ncbi:MAG: hypothetical protein AB7E95_00900 [Kiritimatiellales bacterium]
MKTNWKIYASFIVAILLSGCAALQTADSGSYRIVTVPESRQAFRMVTAEKTKSGLVVSGRVRSRSAVAPVRNRVTVTLLDETGTEIARKDVSPYPVISSQRIQPPEARFTARFDSVAAAAAVIQLN